MRNTALSYFLSGRMPRKLGPRDARSAGPPALPVRSPGRSTTVALLPEGSRARWWTRTARRWPTFPLPGPAPSLRPRLRSPTLRVVAPAEGLALGAGPGRAFPLLTSLGRNLTALAREGGWTRWSAAREEIEEVIDILGKRRTNNPCLVGEPGVGKTAVVEGVAQQLLALRGRPGDEGR